MKTQMISIDEMKPCTPSFRSTEWSATLILLDGKFAAKLSTLGAPQYCSIAYFQLTSNEVVPCHHESIWGFPTRQLWLHIGIGARFTRAREFRSRFPGLIGKIRGMMQSPKLKSNRMGIFFHGCDKRWMVWSLLGFLWVTLRCVSWKSTDVFSHNGSQRVVKVRTLSYQGNLLRIYVESHMEVRDCSRSAWIRLEIAKLCWRTSLLFAFSHGVLSCILLPALGQRCLFPFFLRFILTMQRSIGLPFDILKHSLLCQQLKERHTNQN